MRSDIRSSLRVSGEGGASNGCQLAMVELLGEKQRQLRSRHSDTAAVGELQPSALIASVCVTANCLQTNVNVSISGLVVEYIVAIDVTRVRLPADAFA